MQCPECGQEMYDQLINDKVVWVCDKHVVKIIIDSEGNYLVA